jgi:hypothetical protein
MISSDQVANRLLSLRMRKGVSSGFTVAVGFAMRALLALLLCAGAMQASADAAATVLFSQGSVTAVSQNSSRALHKGDSIVAGDTINTGGDGRIQMRFSDGGLVSLRPNSSFAVDKYNQPTAGSEGSLAFNLIKGGLRTLSGTIGHEDHANYQWYRVRRGNGWPDHACACGTW